MRPVTLARPYTVNLDLGLVPATTSEVLDEIGTRLDGFEPRLSRRRATLWVSLTVRAGDLWHAVLMAMAAVTGTGYPVMRIEAQQSDDLPVARAAAVVLDD